MANTINTRIVLRNGTAAEWEAVKDSVEKALLVGEMGVETDTGLFKLGKKHPTEDRLCTWAELEYANDVPDLSGVTNSVKEATTLEGLGDGAVVGDVGIVKTLISQEPKKDTDGNIEKDEQGNPIYINQKYSYTAYVWSEIAENQYDWAAMDGNYSAENVFTSKDITLAGDFGKDGRGDKITTIGNKKIGDTFAAGSSIQSILLGILSKTLQPSVTNPTASISIASVTAKEVGETYTKPTATLTTNAGSYTYGPATGVTYDSGNVRIASGAEPGTLGTALSNIPYKDSTSKAGVVTLTLSASEYGTHQKKTEDYVTDADQTHTKAYFTDTGHTYTFSGIAKNNASTAIAVDNLGEQSNPKKEISANVVTVADKTSSTIKGGRYCFYGVCNNTLTADNTTKCHYKKPSFDISTLVSEDVRSLKKSDLNGGLPATLEVPLNSTQVIFAAPANKYKTLTAKDGNAQDATVSFDKKTGVKVEGAIAKIGEASTAIDYDVWYVTWTDPIASAKALKLTWA